MQKFLTNHEVFNKICEAEASKLCITMSWSSGKTETTLKTDYVKQEKMQIFYN